MFKRNPRTYLQLTVEFFYPRGGWYRAARYVIYRLRRLPDPAHRISRGIAAGIFTSFTPFFGLHFLIASLLAIMMRGNILAALLATFVGNPLTFPLIAEGSLTLGNLLLGHSAHVHLAEVFLDFGGATKDLWANFMAIFTDDLADWSRVLRFYHRVFLPYTIGGFAPGIVAGFIGYYLSNPLIHAYQRRRVKKLKARYEKRLAKRVSEAGGGDKIG